MTFVLHSLTQIVTRPAKYEAPGPHGQVVNVAHLSVAEAVVGIEASYPAERAILAADALAVSLAAAHDRVTAPLARAAAAFMKANGDGGWAQFGYARLEDHARERFGRCGRSLRDLAALGEAMVRMPQLASALESIDDARPLDRSAAVLVARVAQADTVDAWIDRARNMSVRSLREAIRSSAAGGRNGDITNTEITNDDLTNDATPAINDPEAAPRRLVKLLVPAATMGIFNEALELFRAVEGCNASISSFIEALVAEAMTGPAPADWEVESSTLTPADPRSAIERAHEHSTANWCSLPRAAGRGDWALKMAGASLRRFSILCKTAGIGDAVQLDHQIRELLRLEDEMEIRLADLLATMADRGAWARLRFDGSGHYAQERLRISRSVAADRIRVARGLRQLPVIRRAYERGEIALEPTLHIIRILRGTLPDDQSQAAWVERARVATVKRMRDEARMIERRRLIERPMGSGHDPRTPLPDAEWRTSLWREPGMARLRTEQFGRLAMSNPIPDVFLGLRLPDSVASALLSSIESRRRFLASDVERVAWDQPWPEPDAPASRLIARELFVRCRRIPAWVGLMSLLEEFVATWDPPGTEVRRRSDAVYARAGWRCTAPGCTSRRNLEDHHLVHRSRGGGDELSNRECLCRFHHQRGEHGGLARCRGRAPLGVTWRLGRADSSSWWRNEIRSRSPFAQESPAGRGALPRSSR